MNIYEKFYKGELPENLQKEAVFFKCDPKNKNKITEVFVKRECEDERFRKNDD